MKIAKIILLALSMGIFPILLLIGMLFIITVVIIDFSQS